MDNMENEVVETVEAELVNDAPKKKGKVLDILALIAGILGILACCGVGCTSYIAPVFSIAAIILAIASPKRENGKRSGLAKAGLICGIIGLLIGVLAIVAGGAMVAAIMGAGATPVYY